MRIQFLGSCVAVITLTGGIATAVAQSSKVLDPADPGVATPAVKHESAFSDYQPFREQKIRSWKEVNQEVADNPGMGAMGSMKDMGGKPMAGMDSKTGDGPKSKDGAAGHSMSSMKDVGGKPMAGMDSKAGDAPKGKDSASGHNMETMKDMPGKPMVGMEHQTKDAPKNKESASGYDMGSMKGMPGMTKEAASTPMSKEGHGAMAMAKPQTAPGHAPNAQTADVTASGVVQTIDKANSKVKLTHDPIQTLGWPKMTMFFRLKDGALADQVKEGDKVEFSLEKTASGYVISGFQKGAASHDTKQME